jgi:hypothetical protein
MLENFGGLFLEVTEDWGFGFDDGYSIGIALGDYNNDGYADLMKNVASGEVNSFWQNDFDTNNYLAIKLVGVESNFMAVGAVIDVFCGGIHQYRRVGCGEGFSSQNSYTQYIGLATNTMVDDITVTWPNGAVTITADVAANQIITLFEIEGGCTDPIACNYDPAETTDDGSCTYPGCDDPLACNFNGAGCSDGSCEYITCQGCTDPIADNYDPAATLDDGSCTYSCTMVSLEILTDCWGGEMSWDIVDEFGNIMAEVPLGTYGGQTTYFEDVCLSDGCYTFTINDSYGDGVHGTNTGCSTDGSYSMLDPDLNPLVVMLDPNYGFGISHEFCLPFGTGLGCTDNGACNFDPEAQIDDGSCTFPGCTDPNAATYDPLAGCDDGMCLYYANECPADLNYDLQVNVSDLLIFLQLFGSNCD